MALEDRAATRAVELFDQLARAPHEFDFFQLLRRLESHYRDRPRLARSPRPAEDPVRLGQQPSLAFAPRTVAAFDPGSGGLPPRIEVLFFGLFGPNGPLPIHLTEYVYDRLHNAGDPTLARFADVFHHRLLSLFYRAWADAQPTVQYDRPEDDRFWKYVGALFGMGLPAFRDRDAVPDDAKRYYAGWLACQTRSADGLEAILGDFFQLPVRIDEFVGQWLDIPDDCRFALGAAPETGSLGSAAPIGSQVWSCQQKFRIVFGPLRYEDYLRLLPGREGLVRLTALVRNYLGDELDWDVRLVLKREEVPPAIMGGLGQIGWTAWLDQEGRSQDAADLVLAPAPLGTAFNLPIEENLTTQSS
jgi:type VI secretion system protein ImpH